MDKYLSGIDVPNWVRWIAQDGDGIWWMYSLKPKIKGDRLSERWYPQQHGDWLPMHEGKPPKNWEEELYRWDYE